MHTYTSLAGHRVTESTEKITTTPFSLFKQRNDGFARVVFPQIPVVAQFK
jgi:hypothetical protein